jgi:hypothetical protein
MVQYGDFLAKSTLYDHLVKEGMSESEAARTATEAFVNYNFLPGRARTLLDSFGMTWFMHYKIRIMKEAFRLLKEYPLRSLFAVSGTSVVDVGSPLTDNLAAVVMEGRLPWSMGIGMGLNAPYMLPVSQLGSAAI